MVLTNWARGRLQSFFCFICLSLLLFGCGGSDDLADNQASAIGSNGVRLTLTATRTSDGVAINQISNDQPITLTAEVVDANDDGIVNQIVSLTSGLVQFSPASGSILTNSSGIATASVAAASTLGAGTLTAAVTVGGETIQVTINLEVTSIADGTGTDDSTETEVVDISLALTSAAGSQTIRADAPGTLTIVVTDSDGVAITNELVTLSITQNLAQFGATNSVLLTDSTGIATTTVSAIESLGGGTITVSVTQSDQTFTESLNFEVAEPDVRFGALNGSTFTEGTLLMSTTSIAINETVTVSATFVNADDSVFTGDDIEVLFSSTCSDTDDAEIGESTLTQNGTATVSYAPGETCNSDVIVASATFGGVFYTGTVNVTVGSGVVSEDDIQITVSLTSDASESNTIRADAEGTLTVTVLDSDSAALSDELVTLTVTEGLAEFGATNSAILTDSSGQATTTLRALETIGAGTVTAGVERSSQTVTGTLNFVVAAPNIGFGAYDTATDSFTQNELFFSASSVAQGETITVSASFVDGSLALFTGSDIDVLFSSSCASVDAADIGENATTQGGTATVSYTPNDNCESDIISATATFGGITYTAASNVTIEDGSVTGDDTQVGITLTSDTTEANTVRADAPGTLTVTLADGQGNPIVAAIVAFSAELVTFNPASGTVLTDATGQASIIMNAGDITGADTVTIVVEGELTRTLNYAVAAPSIQLGTIGAGVDAVEGTADDTFTEALDISVNPLSAGGTTTVTVDVVDENQARFITPVDINFTSNCVTSALATIDASVTTVNGVATATYRAQGCEGTDTITATATFGGESFSAESSLEVLQDDIGSIEFVGADPTQITLLETGAQGLSETSTVTFRVRGSQGLPLSNQAVNFALTTTVGGITLTPTSATTDSDGLVSTVVQSGAISTSVGVIATTVVGDISTQSDLLAVTTGVPDQNSMDISPSVCAPEALIWRDEEITVTARASDVFNNPVPDGTAISFRTEGGTIGGVCTTVSGSCSVTWSSQNPVPDNGLVTILATAIGGESFTDKNGNGVFDTGDLLFQDVDNSDTLTPGDIDYDLTEAYLDANFNRSFDSGEEYLDFDSDGVFDFANGLYNGVLCDTASGLCALDGSGEKINVHVRDDMEIVMSGSEAQIIIVRDGLPDSGPDEDLTLNPGAQLDFDIRIEDENSNSMPTGTTVSIATDNGELLGVVEYTISGCNTGSVSFPATLLSDDESDFNLLTITVTTPREIVTTRTVGVQD